MNAADLGVLTYALLEHRMESALHWPSGHGNACKQVIRSASLDESLMASSTSDSRAIRTCMLYEAIPAIEGPAT